MSEQPNDISQNDSESLQLSNASDDYIPEGLTIIFEAPQRWGKTLSGVIFALEAYQASRPIFSNTWLRFSHTPLEFSEVTLEDGRSRFYGGHIFIDELNFMFDARRSISGPNVEFAAFLLQQKKQGCNLTGTTHDLSYLDLRLRDNFDYLVRPRVFPQFPAKPRILKMEITNGPLQPRARKVLTMDCTPYLGLYDTKRTYNPFKTKVEETEWQPKRQRRYSFKS